jgi:hypothetical protein
LVNLGGWKYSDEVRTGKLGGGYILKDISHLGYPFASDIRVVRVFVADGSPDSHNPEQNYGKATEINCLTLGSQDMEPIQDNDRGAQISDAEKTILPYTPIHSISKSFQTKGGISKTLTQDLRVTQTYLFTNYDNSPSHEPSGLLRAARLYPMVQFEFIPGNRQSPPPRYFRADFRIEFNLGQLSSSLNSEPGVSHQAGVFKD